MGKMVFTVLGSVAETGTQPDLRARGGLAFFCPEVPKALRLPRCMMEGARVRKSGRNALNVGKYLRLL